MTELEQLHERQRQIIIGTCNTIGCKDCHLKWEDGCASSELQNQIMDIEFKECKEKSL